MIRAAPLHFRPTADLHQKGTCCGGFPDPEQDLERGPRLDRHEYVGEVAMGMARQKACASGTALLLRRRLAPRLNQHAGRQVL